MVSEADNKFTWVIKDFSSLQCEKNSGSFLIGGCKWCLTACPEVLESGCMSLFLQVADRESLPLGWKRHAKVSLKVVHQISKKSSILLEACQLLFNKYNPVHFLKDLPLAKLNSKDGWFLVNDELKIVAEVNVLEVIGKSDVLEGSQKGVRPMKKMKMEHYGTGSSDMHKETRVDVNGFQVSASQVASVRCIFEKHPDFASKVRSNNQHLKSSYISALLGLIETLCQLPEKPSDDDLTEASAAVSYLTQAGFKVDWLEKKLEEVKEKKKKVNTGKAELQRMEEELQNLTKKCSDLKDLVDKQNVALSFNDVV